MATLLQGGLLEFLTPIFIFLFIFTVFFALLEKIKFLGEKPGTHALISFCLSFLFLIVPEARELVNFVTPWFVVLLLFGLLIIIGLLFLGYKESALIEGVTEGGPVVAIVIVTIIILFLIALTKVFGASVLEPGGTGFTGTIRYVLFNPKTLGVIFILIVAMEVVRRFAPD